MKTPRLSLSTIRVLGEFVRRYPEPLSGADIFNETKILSGTLYPILYRLEGLGWIAGDWEAVDPVKEGRPRRRLYRMKPKAHKLARAILDDLPRMGD